MQENKNKNPPKNLEREIERERERERGNLFLFGKTMHRIEEIVTNL